MKTVSVALIFLKKKMTMPNCRNMLLLSWNIYVLDKDGIDMCFSDTSIFKGKCDSFDQPFMNLISFYIYNCLSNSFLENIYILTPLLISLCFSLPTSSGILLRNLSTFMSVLCHIIASWGGIR